MYPTLHPKPELPMMDRTGDQYRVQLWD